MAPVPLAIALPNVGAAGARALATAWSHRGQRCPTGRRTQPRSDHRPCRRHRTAPDRLVRSRRADQTARDAGHRNPEDRSHRNTPSQSPVKWYPDRTSAGMTKEGGDMNHRARGLATAAAVLCNSRPTCVLENTTPDCPQSKRNRCIFASFPRQPGRPCGRSPWEPVSCRQSALAGARCLSATWSIGQDAQRMPHVRTVPIKHIATLATSSPLRRAFPGSCSPVRSWPGGSRGRTRRGMRPPAGRAPFLPRLG